MNDFASSGHFLQQEAKQSPAGISQAVSACIEAVFQALERVLVESEDEDAPDGTTLASARREASDALSRYLKTPVCTSEDLQTRRLVYDRLLSVLDEEDSIVLEFLTARMSLPD